MGKDETPDPLSRDLFETFRKIMGREPEVEPERASEGPREEEGQKKDSKLRFDLKPKDIKRHLDRFVIRQEDAKRVLATAVCDHYNHIRECGSKKDCRSYAKQNVIMLGPTGIGKTHLVRHLAELIGVPFVKADATKFSETGYVGGDVEDLIRDLVAKADNDIELAQYGIVYLDEIDKVASPSNLTGRDVSGSGVQRGLLKIMEETDVSLRNPQDIQSQFQSLMELQKKGKASKPTVNTRHILFIVSGSFDALMPIIERRKKDHRIGFADTGASGASALAPAILSEVQTQDFIEFGFESEFIGRLPVRVVCHDLSEEDLYNILTVSEDSILKQHIRAFGAYGVDMHIEEKALWEIAKKAAAEKTGARGLFTVSERVFRNLKYELPSSQLKHFALTAEMVQMPEEAPDVLLKEERKERAASIEKEIRDFEAHFFQKNGLRIAFSQDALEAIAQRIFADGGEVRELLGKTLSNYRYGLELIQKKSGAELFTITRETIENPNAVLNRWIKETYEKNDN